MQVSRTAAMALTMLVATGSVAGQVVPGGAPRDTVGLSWSRRMLAAMHAEQTIVKSIDTELAVQRKAGKSQVPTVFFDSFTARVHRRTPEIVDSLAWVFARSLSVPDLKELVQFYESPLGRRFADAQVVFGLESAEIGKRWGTRLALDVMKDLIDAGLMPGLGH